MGRLDGKATFITDAGAGIARAAADVFSREGASIVLAEIDTTTGAAAERALREAGKQALFLASDESRMITGAAIPADGGRSAY